MTLTSDNAHDYFLQVRFLDNERPWSGRHSNLPCHAPQNDEEAIEWCVAMQTCSDENNLRYTYTLFDGDRHIPTPPVTP